MANNDRTDIAVPLMRRNYILSIINGGLVGAGMRAIDLNTVLSLLVLGMIETEWGVGVAIAVFLSTMVATQVFASRILDAVPRKRPVYVAASVVRVVAMAFMTWLLLTGIGRDRTFLLAWFLVGLFFRMVAGGFAILAWADINARSVPTTKRGSLMKFRRIGALILSVAISVPLVRYMLGPTSPFRFPANYGILFLAATVLCTLAWGVFCMVREPSSHAARRRLTFMQHLVRGIRIYRRDPMYRRLLRLRIALGAAVAVPPFFITFARKGLAVPEHWAAGFLAVQITSEIAGAFILGQVSDDVGNRKVMVTVAWLAAATFAFATLATVLVPATSVTGLSPSVILVGCAFAGLGLLMSGRKVGELNYILDIAPAPKRPSYIGFGNAFMIPVSFVPMVVGYALPRIGYLAVFGAALFVSLAAVLLASKLDEPRDVYMAQGTRQSEQDS